MAPDLLHAKQQAAARALEFVEPGMRLGLGTGSTASEFVALLGAKVRDGLRVTCLPTSEQTAAQAKDLGVSLATLDEEPELDLTVDGADEYDPALRLIKGGGGALLREKIIATASKRMVVIADHTKAVAVLGRFPLPVEVNRFGLEATRRLIRQAAALCGCEGEIVLRTGSGAEPFLTDGGHLILDCRFGRIGDPEDLALRLNAIAGVVEHGLFLGIARTIVSAGPDGVTLLGQAGPG